MNYQLLAELADGHFHSGAKLAEKFGVTRTAVWHQIEKLKNMGLDIYSVTGRGYKLSSPIALLNQQTILSGLQVKERIQVLDVLPEIDSTNAYIKPVQTPAGSFVFALAEYQSKGRGRLGRQWFSPLAQNLYFSSKFSLPVPVSQCQALSLVMGLAISEALNQFIGRQVVGVKWPNDLYVENRKLGGILIELNGEIDAVCECIVGVGLNVNIPVKDLEALDRPAISMQALYGESIDRNALAARIINTMLGYLDLFFEKGFDAFYERWFSADVMYGKEVYVQKGSEKYYGTCEGVNHDGELILNHNGRRETYNGGEVSLRNVEPKVGLND